MDINELRKLTSVPGAGSALDELREQMTLASQAPAAFASQAAFGRSMDRYERGSTMMMPNIPSIWETQAKMFMAGLKSQVEELEGNLQPNQELVMTCWHGHEKFQVLSVRMPSKNVVALNCRDSEGDETQVTGHMNSVTFSFRIVTAREPVERRRIGFDMPDVS